MSAVETQSTIEAWRVATFGAGPDRPSAALFRMVVRAHTEMAELLVRIATGAGRKEVLREIADVAIVLYGVAELGGFDLMARRQPAPDWVGAEDLILFANSRLGELVWRIHGGRPFANVARHIVAILRLACIRLGSTLDAEVNAKMAINRARKWAMTDAGHGHHVEEGVQ